MGYETKKTCSSSIKTRIYFQSSICSDKSRAKNNDKLLISALKIAKRCYVNKDAYTWTEYNNYLFILELVHGYIQQRTTIDGQKNNRWKTLEICFVSFIFICSKHFDIEECCFKSHKIICPIFIYKLNPRQPQLQIFRTTSLIPKTRRSLDFEKISTFAFIPKLSLLVKTQD